MIRSKELDSLIANSPIVFVDAGARGDLEGNWLQMPDIYLSVLAFEPDATAQIDWENTKKNRIVERCALWECEDEVKIHIGKIPSTSSVWPPNTDYLQRFDPKHVLPRETQSIFRVKGRPLDNICIEKKLKPDFLKIDTQGSELQILIGADKVLKDSVFGALIETWAVPVHKGQGLSHEIIALMKDKGFEIFQSEVAAAWDRKVVTVEHLSSKRQIIGYDFLFFRDPLTIVERLADPAYATKFSSVAEMYGHIDLALEILEISISGSKTKVNELKALKNELLLRHKKVDNEVIKSSLTHRIINKIAKK